MKTKKIPKEYVDLLDINKIIARTPNVDKLKIILKHDKIKGTGIYATKNIKENELIAYYKMKIFDYRTYNSPTNCVYAFDIYTQTGRESKNLIGDIDLSSFPNPLKDIPYWAPFANEPFPDQQLNAEIDTNLSENYANRKRARVGSYMVYKLVATKNIKPGDEITIYYGKDYKRNYDFDIKKFENEK